MVPEEEDDQATTHDEYHHRFDYEELSIATGSFSPSNLIGRGSHGSVYKASLPHHHHHHLQLVAVKKSTSGLNPHVGLENSRKLENEISTLSRFKERRRISTPYIVNFLGASSHRERNEKLLVMEFLPNGSLEDLLHNDNLTHTSSLSWSKRVEIVIQLAKAIEFLHQGCNPLCVIHRDIKPSNILLDSSWNPKLVDFGLAVLLDSASSRDHHPEQQPAGTIGYMDPRYTTSNELTTKVDVYSFGVVVFEIISGRKVLDVRRSPASIVEWSMGLIGEKRGMEIWDRRVALPAEFMEGTRVIEKLLYVAARCVAMNPEDRPSMGEVVAGLCGCCEVRCRVRLPSWVNVVMRNLKRVSKKGKLESIKVRKSDGGRQRDVSKGKLLLWELLADITLT